MTRDNDHQPKPPWWDGDYKPSIRELNSQSGELHDVVCECGHWIEEHDAGYQNDYGHMPCESCDCPTFAFSEHENHPEIMAQRIEVDDGHKHVDCECALCRIRHPRFRIKTVVDRRQRRRGHENGHGDG